jgi:hypothetical protein
MREFKDSVTGKDKDDERAEIETQASTGETRERDAEPARHGDATP